MRFFDVSIFKFIKRIVVFAFLITCLTSCKNNNMTTKVERAETHNPKNVNVEEEQGDNKKISDEIVVYIYGEIKKPDVYKLDKDARVCDLVEMAGGYTKNAAIYLNLAAKLNDGDQIKVLSKEEYENNNGQKNNDGSVSLDSNSDSASDMVNINTAGIDELMELPGIGQTKASAIVEYREKNGTYNDTSDIKNVSGIGEAHYERIKEKIEI